MKKPVHFSGAVNRTELIQAFLGTSWVSLIPLAPLSLVGFYMWAPLKV